MVLGWGLFSLGVKQTMHGADHSPPSSATVTDSWKILTLSNYLVYRHITSSARTKYEVHTTVWHKFPRWNNFDIFLLEIKLQTWMWEWNVYTTLSLDNTSWHLSWMAKNQNLGLGQRFYMPYIYFYLLKSPKYLE